MTESKYCTNICGYDMGWSECKEVNEVDLGEL